MSLGVLPLFSWNEKPHPVPWSPLRRQMRLDHWTAPFARTQNEAWKSVPSASDAAFFAGSAALPPTGTRIARSWLLSSAMRQAPPITLPDAALPAGVEPSRPLAVESWIVTGDELDGVPVSPMCHTPV